MVVFMVVAFDAAPTDLKLHVFQRSECTAKAKEWYVSEEFCSAQNLRADLSNLSGQQGTEYHRIGSWLRRSACRLAMTMCGHGSPTHFRWSASTCRHRTTTRSILRVEKSTECITRCTCSGVVYRRCLGLARQLTAHGARHGRLACRRKTCIGACVQQ